MRAERALWVLLGALLALVPIWIVLVATDPAHAAERRVRYVSATASTFTIVYTTGERLRMPSQRTALAYCADGLDSEGVGAYRRCTEQTIRQYRVIRDLAQRRK